MLKLKSGKAFLRPDPFGRRLRDLSPRLETVYGVCRSRLCAVPFLRLDRHVETAIAGYPVVEKRRRI